MCAIAKCAKSRDLEVGQAGEVRYGRNAPKADLVDEGARRRASLIHVIRGEAGADLVDERVREHLSVADYDGRSCDGIE